MINVCFIFEFVQVKLKITNKAKMKNNAYFKYINSSFSIRQKIEFSVFKYDASYFIDQKPSMINNLPNEILRPLRMINKKNLNDACSRDQRSKTKKLSWCMKQLDNSLFSEFKEKIERFTTLREAFLL